MKKNLQPGQKVLIVAPEDQLVVAQYVHRHSDDAVNINPTKHIIELVNKAVNSVKWKIKTIDKKRNKIILETKDFIEKILELKKGASHHTKVFISKVVKFFESNEFFCKADYIQVV